MPKDTFNNLSDEKKNRIFNAAVQEFSAVRFSEASLNKIVKAAGIPWGSFYQYFNDKEDIYLYMYEKIGNEKRTLVHQPEVLSPDADFFEICIQATKATFEWSKVNPEYIQIGILMEIDNTEFITKLRAASIEVFKRKLERDKVRGFIKPEVDSELVGEMLYSLMWKQVSLVGWDENMYLKKLSDGIKIIKEGIAVPKD